MHLLGNLWRWWAESWRAPRRARWLYVVLAAGFGGLALAGALAGDAAVAALAGVAAVVTVALAALAPRLSRWTGPPRRVR